MLSVADRTGIEVVPAHLVALLDAAGSLPVPARVPLPGQRYPTAAEREALTWVVCWNPPGVAAAVAAYRDVYDYHLARDVREVIIVHGSRRGVDALLRHIIDEANALGFPCIGGVDPENAIMVRRLRRLGKLSRVVFGASP